MSANTVLGLVLLGAASLASSAHAADPSIHQVYQAAESGRMTDAQAMMAQVLRDHPDSAKAHFVEAELMAKQGRLAEARTELASAERLEPGLPFAKPQAIQALKARLAGMAALPARVSPASTASRDFPWSQLFLGAGLLALVLVAIRFMLRRSTPPVVYPAGYGPTPAPPYAGGGMMPVGPSGGGMGSGILGGLATGAAVGAGMVAGEELMHHFLDGNNAGSRVIPLANADDWTTPQNDMGGQDFGISDGSWDDGSSLGSDDWS